MGLLASRILHTAPPHGKPWMSLDSEVTIILVESQFRSLPTRR
jgi:hypothetical protein